jgi:hypothetical protein
MKPPSNASVSSSSNQTRPLPLNSGWHWHQKREEPALHNHEVAPWRSIINNESITQNNTSGSSRSRRKGFVIDSHPGCRPCRYQQNIQVSFDDLNRFPCHSPHPKVLRLTPIIPVLQLTYTFTLQLSFPLILKSSPPFPFLFFWLECISSTCILAHQRSR